ncbi:carboxylating nicotinate-nucleotide diphosphorylase [Marinoscillum sp. MHG1-6]|uniref:carboxylating nicotinate-nucleotide diphosphorylase n=1 Tax=Marinoscillum sp. MHG1-6 TaxID=2959627 RepID=UPI0021583EE2|nr:carboxylating nicotinate-nucleotide diphosphorylase [Marinoscillum sp. MHG1-6]
MIFPYLTEEKVNQFISSALNEDIGEGDYSSLGSIPEDQVSQAKLLIKDDGILAGVELAERIFKTVDPNIQVEVFKKDGSAVEIGDVGFQVTGNSRAILGAERTVLNCMQRMSGIATYTRQMSQLLKGTEAKLLDTRKTTPNFRLAEKWAVAIGGGVNHRSGLYDMVMLKDNHIDYAGSVKEAINSTVAYLEANNLDLKIEVEVRSLIELKQVIDTGKVFRVLLDNMLPSDMKQAVAMVNGSMETEASGGITEKNIRDIAETGVNYISVGALTHSYKSLDLSLKAEKTK